MRTNKVILEFRSGVEFFRRWSWITHAAVWMSLLTLEACTRMTVSDYDRTGKEQQQQEADQVECEKKAIETRSNAGGWFTDSFLGMDTVYNKGFDECMQGKGYKRR